MKYLLVLEQEKKITLAAERCFISQSALSQQLRKIEQEAGAPLFYRRNNMWLPTEEGKILLKGFRRILSIYDNSIQQIQKISGHMEQEIRLAMPSSRATFVFADIYSAFKKEEPTCTLSLVEAAFTDIPRLVAGGTADMGLFVSESLLPADYSSAVQYHPLGSENFVVVMQRENPLAKKAVCNRGKLEIKDLNEEKLVMYGKNRFLRQTIDRFFDHYQVVPQESLSFDSTTTCIQFVRNGFGCAIVPAMLAHDTADLAVFSLEPQIAWELGIITGRQRMLSEGEKKIIELIRRQVSDMKVDSSAPLALP